MKWAGKLVGGVIGAAFGPWGIAIGALLGHQYDAMTTPRARVRGSSRPRRSDSVGEYADIGGRFFGATFQVMGYIAKADGHVSAAEINAARAVMQELKLDSAQVQLAIEHFTRGKAQDFEFDMAVLGLKRACQERPDLLRVFLELQVRAALAGTNLEGPARSILQRCGRLLELSPLELVHIEAVARIRRSSGGSAGGGAGGASTAQEISIDEAYEVLEVASDAPDEDVVKAYRRQLSKHHPDKLKANGLPDSMLEHAKQRTQQIIEAYELIRERRGIA
jgi:DnaJ like chaperone protein